MSKKRMHSAEEREKLIAQGLKGCSICRQVKPLADFGKKASLPGGVQVNCKACISVLRKETYRLSKEK